MRDPSGSQLILFPSNLNACSPWVSLSSGSPKEKYSGIEGRKGGMNNPKPLRNTYKHSTE